MTRIIAGQMRGRRLETLRGQNTRPTADRVRQVVFDILTPSIEGCRFLDLCAGTGAVGLEAVSRGAQKSVLLEKDSAAVRVIKRNARALGLTPRVEIIEGDARSALRALVRRAVPFDTIYLDPPYESDLYETLLNGIGAGGLLAPDGRLVAEHFHKRPLAERFGSLVRNREERIGDHRLSFYAVV